MVGCAQAQGQDIIGTVATEREFQKRLIEQEKARQAQVQEAAEQAKESGEGKPPDPNKEQQGGGN